MSDPNVEATGEETDEAFDAADAHRTAACEHPSCRLCSWLTCKHCNVLVMEGRIYDRGGPAETEIKRRWSLAYAPGVSVPRSKCSA